MTFADKCKLLAKRRSRHAAPAASDRRLRAALLPRRERYGERRPDAGLDSQPHHTAVLRPRKS
ncbi:MAG: hypothetical protein E5W98_33460 [Mesorhizobium sp.]|nr:MAG: hypothetical protein E5W98_33460 [Mesorhizobium sp.]